MTLVDDLRLDLGDDSGTPILSDAQYIAFLVKAGRRLNRVLNLSGTSAIIVSSVTGEITSPTTTVQLAILQDLILLQVECLILQRNVNEDLEEGGAGTLIRDGEQTVDTTALTRLREAHLNSDHNPCKELELAILQYKLDGSGKLVW